MSPPAVAATFGIGDNRSRYGAGFRRPVSHSFAYRRGAAGLPDAPAVCDGDRTTLSTARGRVRVGRARGRRGCAWAGRAAGTESAVAGGPPRNLTVPRAGHWPGAVAASRGGGRRAWHSRAARVGVGRAGR